jgi:hypothetical protein
MNNISRSAAPSGRPVPDAFAELTGLHGAFVFPELLLQQIWLRGEFDMTGLRLRDGRRIHLKKRGRWNRLGGPDFHDAEFGIENTSGAAPEFVRGDVEVHMRAQDWDAHGHARDPAYADVKFHEDLFPSGRSHTEGVAGARIPILELLPLLEKDIEAYAEEAAVEGIAGRPFSQLRAALAKVPVDQLAEHVTRHSSRRWDAKSQLARRRIDCLGWEGACHQSALEVLGYRPNRAQMLAVADALPLEIWRTAVPSIAEEAWSLQAGNWAQAGVRPANLPRRRLAQYARWVSARPDWPARLRSLLSIPGIGAPAPARLNRTALRKTISDTVCAGELGGTRFDTWWCDAALPLLSAASATGTESPGSAQHLRDCWLAWPVGDAPAELVKLAREFGVGTPSGKDRPTLRQGQLQGLLGWLATIREA